MLVASTAGAATQPEIIYEYETKFLVEQHSPAYLIEVFGLEVGRTKIRATTNGVDNTLFLWDGSGDGLTKNVPSLTIPVKFILTYTSTSHTVSVYVDNSLWSTRLYNYPAGWRNAGFKLSHNKYINAKCTEATLFTSKDKTLYNWVSLQDWLVLEGIPQFNHGVENHISSGLLNISWYGNYYNAP